MQKTGWFVALVLTIVVVAGCGSGTETTEQPDAGSTGNGEQARPEISTKEQYVVEARRFVDELIEIVNKVNDPASAAVALEACNDLKPTAEELSAAARKLIDGVRDDPSARAELGEYVRSECHSDADLQPLISKLGESEKESEYPKLLSVVGELLETSLHNHF